MNTPGTPSKKLPDLKADHENLNPFSAKGNLSFTSFIGVLLAAIVFNLLVFALIRSQLIPARVALDRDRVLTFYGIWFLFSSLGFMAVANSFIKRWAAILGDRELPGYLRSIIRISLLSPVLGSAMTFATLIFFPGSPAGSARDETPRFALVGTMILFLILGIAASVFLPVKYFGLERAHFRDSVATYIPAVVSNGKNPVPNDKVLGPVLATATPAMRYLFWMGSDFLRTKMIEMAINSAPEKYCSEKMGYLQVEVRDCFFFELRRMASHAPIVSPYFALYFESQYRQTAATDLKTELSGDLEKVRSGAATSSQSPSAESYAMRGFAGSILMVSNQLELLEPGPLFIRRTDLTQPSYLLRAFASPELPLVEAGQDVQRFVLLQKLMPVFEFQMKALRKEIERGAEVLGPSKITLEGAIKQLEVRLAAIQKDPLAIGER